MAQQVAPGGGSARLERWVPDLDVTGAAVGNPVGNSPIRRRRRTGAGRHAAVPRSHPADRTHGIAGVETAGVVDTGDGMDAVDRAEGGGVGSGVGDVDVTDESGSVDVEAAAPLGVRMIRHGPWGALAERWVPEPLRSARVAPGRRGAAVVCAVGLIAAAVAAFLVWRDRPQARPIPAAPQAASLVTDVEGVVTSTLAGRSASSVPSGTAPLAGTAPANGTGPAATISSPTAAVTVEPSVIVVSVTGLVKHPGLVRLSPGARVADAIAAAGGVVGRGDITGMNLAARLTDGASVVVGETGAGSVSAGENGPPSGSAGGAGAVADGSVSGPGPPAPIDLNTADVSALDMLPGVGPVTAAAIVAYRQEHGPFTSVDQLQAIPGIGPARFAQIAAHVTVGGTAP